METLRRALLGMMFLMISVLASAQTQEVSGNVTDAKGEAAIGATVTEKGTRNATMTDVNGHFVIKVKKGAELEISYIGFDPKVVQARPNMVIQLSEANAMLDELVVIGYGTARKKDLTGSVIQIRPDKIANQNPSTVQDVLRGTAGLNVGYNADAKGGGSLNIRGQRSVFSDNNHNSPLLILDGMMFYGELSEINPDDIEQIDVLKDASSAAIYGAKAANGVIIITTKKGKTGKPVVNVSANVGFVQKSAYRDRFKAAGSLQHRVDWLEQNYYGIDSETGEYGAYKSGAYKDRPYYFTNPSNLPEGVTLDQWRGYTQNEEGESDKSIWAKRLGFKDNVLANFLNDKITDWEDLSMRTGLRQDYNASVSGASDRSSYYMSVGYLRNEGVFIDDDYKAIRANLKVNSKVTNWLELGANINFQDRSDGNVDMDEDYQLRNSLWADYKDADGNLVQYPNGPEYAQRGYNFEYEKQFLQLEKGYTTLNTIFNAKVNLPFNITYSFNIAPRYQFFYDRYFMSADLPGSDPNKRGANREQAKRFDWSLNNTLSWDYTFAKAHHFTVTLAQEAEERRYWQDRIEARNILPTDALGFHNTQNGDKSASSFSSNDTHSTADALLGRLQYVYNDRYLLSASVRRDGYSAFGSSNPYAWFPSVAAGWTFTNEKFWKWNFMDYGKVRASFGKNGNRSLDDPYKALANLNSGGGKMMGYILPSGDLSLVRYLIMGRMANPNLQWEKTASWNFGLDFSFLNQRITGNLDFYFMKTTNMIMNQKLPGFSGFGSITTNLGQVNNNGIELTLNTVNIKTKDFEWDTQFSFAFNDNKIKHLYYQYEDVTDAAGNVVGRKEMDDVTNGWFINKSIGEIWGYKVIGIWQKDQAAEAAKYGQRPGDPIVWNNPANDEYNEDGTVKKYVYNNDDKVFLGKKNAPVRWSMRNDFTIFKDLTIGLSIYSLMGHKSSETMYLNFDDDGGRTTYAMQNLQKKEYWTLNNPTNKYGRINAIGPTGAERPGRIYNRSFVRFDNLSVGYTLPRKWVGQVGLSRVKVYANVQNMFTIHSSDWVYGDPETGNMGNRIFNFGLNVTL